MRVFKRFRIYIYAATIFLATTMDASGLSDQAEKDCLALYATTKTCAEYGRDVNWSREKCMDFADKVKERIIQNRPDLDLYMTLLMIQCKLVCVDQTPFTLSYPEFKSQHCGHMK